MRKSQYFPFECSVLNKVTGTIFISSSVWRGPWLGIEPGTFHTRSQLSTTRLSRRRYIYLMIFVILAHCMVRWMSRGLTNVRTQIITLIAKFMAFVFYFQCLSEVGLWSSRLTVSDSFTQRRGGTTPVWFTSSGLPQYSHGKAILFVGQFCIWTTLTL